MDRNPGIPTVMSFFIPGLGQIYNGQILKGLILMPIYFVAAAFWWLIIPIFIAVPVWLFSMYDAYAVRVTMNARGRP
jgi:TM2 domain-containing membrane protein YozV